jgi:glycosyltransferase involved in cell wall biosynthesis
MVTGMEVFALPPAGTIAVANAVDQLVSWIDADPPEAILFWNALAPYKLLLADVLLETRIFDVSPGEMFFASLDRYFAKTRIRGELPCRDGRDYGARLSGVIVKYAAEARRAEEVLGAQTFVIPNGVPLPARRPFRPPGPVLVLGTSARISPQKKLEELVDALRIAAPRLPPHVLRIAGGPERGAEEYAQELRKRADGLCVEWLGEVDVSEFLPAIDVFVMISEPAGCPNASLEAMAEGLAVIATDFGGASEQVQDGITGRLVPRGDVAAFAEAMVEVGNMRGEIQRMGEAGRMRAEALFDVRRMVGDYKKMLCC